MPKRLLLVALIVLAPCGAHLLLPRSTAARGSGEQAQATRLPWSGWWWPLLDSRNPNLYDAGGPAEKYDSYCQNLGWGNPGFQQWEYENHRSTDPEASWWGHCHAWSAAAVLEPEPVAAGYDAGIYFSVGDLKGLVTEAYYAPHAEDYGERYNGRAGDDRNDIYPGLFHQVIRYYVGQQRVALVADIDAGVQVWNYPLYRYEMEFTPDSQYSNVTHVAARVYYADDAVKPDFVGVQPLVKDYTYWIETQGNDIVDSAWEGDSLDDHPDFLWVPNGRDPEQTLLDMEVVRGILTPQPVPGCAEYLPNGDFGTGEFAPWADVGNAEVTDDDDPYAWLGGYDDAYDVIYQTMAIPSPATTASLTYLWAMTTEEEDHPYDYLKVTVRDAAGNVLQTLQTMHDGMSADTWQSSSFDLRPYVGRTIQIHFEATTDDSNTTSFYVDDVHFNVCTGNVPTPTSPPPPTPTPTLGPAPVGCRNSLENGTFESGDLEGWDTGSPWTHSSGQAEVTDWVAYGGDYSAWLGGYVEAEDFLTQRVDIPSAPSRVRLTYWWMMETEEEQHGYDFLYVMLLDAEGEELTTLQTLDDGAVADQWQSAAFDLGAYAGRTIQVSFYATGDEENITSFYIDDVVLEVCGGPPPTPTARLLLPVVLKRR